MVGQFFLYVGVEHNTHGWARSSYQSALIPCKESMMILCNKKNVCYVCVCMWKRRGDKRNEGFKKKMYINKENTKYKSVALQGRTTDYV